MRSAKTTLKRASFALAVTLLGAALFAGSARAAFGFTEFDGETTDQLGNAFTQADGHPYTASTTIKLNQGTDPEGNPVPDEYLRNLEVELPRGFVANPLSTASRCTLAEFTGGNENSTTGLCRDSSQVGVIDLEFATFGIVFEQHLPLYNLVPSPGEPAELGFRYFKTINLIKTAVREAPGGEYRVFARVHNASNALAFIGSTVTLWGTPGDPSHDPFRGKCLNNFSGESNGLCPVTEPETPLVTMPGECTPFGVGLESSLEAESWLGSKAGASFFSHLPGEPLRQQGPTGCGLVPFDPVASAKPTSHEAETPSGLRFSLDVPDSGLLSKEGIAQSAIREAVVTLPEGVTINPSQASGLGVCTQAQYASTELSFFSNPGCPSDSKIGTVLVHTPLLEEPIEGEVFVAQPHENPFGSLLALYVVLKEPQRGILVKLPGEVSPDPRTGQIVTTFDNLPQLPFSSFEFKFREGARSPLVTPPACGTYTTRADFTPWSAIDAGNPAEVRHSPSSFEITSGIGGAPCPPGGVAPFHPGFSAGAINNNAGSYSPFDMRLTRNDGEQDMTKFSSVLPRGVSAKIAGLTKCPDSALAAAKAKTGRAELASPSCRASSEIGHVLAGAGVGSVLIYVPGKVYLAGPYNGSPLSAAVIVPAVAGPFDVGTVVVREALSLDPRSAEVHVDGDRSDPIPHILQGIPLKVRDIRVYVDRPDFTINPTSCDPFQVKGTLFGSYLDVFSPADDVPVSLAARFQAANCANLGFKPKLSLKLKGGTRRGAFPALHAVLSPRPGDANIGAAVVTLPHSAFLEQGHIRTICTRVQYAAGAGNGAQCPQGSIYGQVKAFTPLLDEALQGPVYLRSSSHKLPDLVFALHGIVNIEVVGRIDSIHGGIRTSFEEVPDAPVSKLVLDMQGAKKGLIVNSTNLCRSTNLATVKFTAQSGKALTLRSEMQNGCKKSASKHRHH